MITQQYYRKQNLNQVRCIELLQEPRNSFQGIRHGQDIQNQIIVIIFLSQKVRKKNPKK